MKKSEIFRKILSVVCDFAEVQESDVLSSKRTEEVTSARCAIIGITKEYGITNAQVQSFLNLRSHGSVCYHRRQFNTLSETSRPFRYLLSSARHELDKILSITCQ